MTGFKISQYLNGNAVITPIILGLGALFVWWIVSDYTSPLRQYPGPFLAKWTNLWRFFLVRTGSYHLHIRKLHQQYGPILRIGPNHLDLDFPELAKTLYGTDVNWRKTEFYLNNSVVINHKIIYTLFSELDPSKHVNIKRPIAKFFSQGNVLAKEVLVDAVIQDMCKQLEDRFDNKSCDLGEWIAFCAWDILGNLAFSQNLGYLEKGTDHDGSIAASDKSMDYFAATGQIPWMDHFLDKNPVVRIGPPNLGNITRIATEHMIKRLQSKDTVDATAMPDYLQHFVDIKNAQPDTVTEVDVIIYLLTTLIAGADTTAITMRAIFYYALRTPGVYRKMEEEVLSAKLGEPAQYSSARALPYLEAAVREGMRMHPGVCMLLERYVPDSGLTLPDGHYVPAGTAVGLNPYVVGRNKDVYGDDVDTFRPERWLKNEGESDDSYRERIRLYNAADLTFGGGSRVCLGRYIAQMEVYKVVATLISRFEIELVDPKQEWEVVGSWFPRQKGLQCNIIKRRA
ncbi:cytochrome P450 [Hypoxylon cercidicola]|nr:cytochrome P450 [Hypoxylon cercidicola]